MPQKGGSVEHSIREIINFIRASRVTSVRGGLLRESPNGTTIQIDGGGGGSKIVSRCPFGELTSIPDTDPPETGILGGIIHCGDKNFAVPNKEINLASDGVTLIYLEIDVTANIDDAGEILLPGIETSSETDPATFWESDAWAAGPPATQYPDNTRPVVSTGIGKIIVPIGKLTIADGAATLEPVGCGNITISHCGGTLTAARG